MQDIDGIAQPCRVDHPVGSGAVPDPALFDAFTYRRDRFAVVRCLPTLNLVELIARVMPCIFWKLAQSLERITDEDNGLHLSNISVRIYKCKRRVPREFRTSCRFTGNSALPNSSALGQSDADPIGRCWVNQPPWGNGRRWPTSANLPPGCQATGCNLVRNLPKDGLRHQYATVPVGTSGDRLETHSHLPSECHIRSFVDEMFATLPFFI